MVSGREGELNGEAGVELGRENFGRVELDNEASVDEERGWRLGIGKSGFWILKEIDGEVPFLGREGIMQLRFLGFRPNPMSSMSNCDETREALNSLSWI